MNAFERAEEAARFIQAQTSLRPRMGLVLGSGMGAFADELADATRIPYAEIPHYPRPATEGHAGCLVIGTIGQVPLAVMQGRVHLYEGLPISEVVFPMRVFGRMGISTAILTSAAGGINRDLNPGSLLVLADHINLQGTNPLIGPNDERFGVRFPDLSEAYDKRCREIAVCEAQRLGLKVAEGVYAALSGPNYETPAEIRFLRNIGADVVGMSTVPEAITARHMDMRVLAIACVTNMAAGILDHPLTHQEVLETGRRMQTALGTLLRSVIAQISV